MSAFELALRSKGTLQRIWTKRNLKAQKPFGRVTGVGSSVVGHALETLQQSMKRTENESLAQEQSV